MSVSDHGPNKAFLVLLILQTMKISTMSVELGRRSSAPHPQAVAVRRLSLSDMSTEAYMTISDRLTLHYALVITNYT